MLSNDSADSGADEMSLKAAFSCVVEDHCKSSRRDLQVELTPTSTWLMVFGG